MFCRHQSPPPHACFRPSLCVYFPDHWKALSFAALATVGPIMSVVQSDLIKVFLKIQPIGFVSLLLDMLICILLLGHLEMENFQNIEHFTMNRGRRHIVVSMTLIWQQISVMS